MKGPKILFGLLAAIAVSCGDSGGDGNGGGGNAAASVLIAPINNSECTTGTPVSSAQTAVTFEWNPAQNATGYFLYVKNLLTGTSSQYNAGEALTYNVTLLKATPYSWYVSARGDGQNSTPSQTWKFYNAGDAVSNYAPFPAELVAPAMSSTTFGSPVVLQWTGSDVENDIVDYKIYFGTTANPTTLLTTVTQTQANATVTSGTTYYWKIVTTDAQGNSSTSQTFQFKAQ
ncbi:hypothetical protein [Flavobacterium sp.]|uniref:hypothetical protein n=1 Tax=Flavobacterium sp. TaxID=239 RepID=UPI0012101C4C|nr:hypothetical protein [Flavobacterium sp.]RZJ70309.1 MAG: hypothetical protein EOO49_14355 [Flavobacterium sp.]